MKKIFILAALALIVACKGDKLPGEEGDIAIKVTGVSIDRSSLNIKEGESVTLVATVTPATANNKNVAWFTSNETVAIVDNNGKVTGIKAGSATITAMTEDGGKKATCALTVETNLAPSVTVGAEHISAVSVVLNGKANIINNGSSTMIMGFQYYKLSGSTSPTAITVLATDPDKDYNYSVSISELEPNTSYLYYSFARQNGQDTYGEAKEFTTKDVASLLETKDASAIEATRATLHAKLDLTDVQYKSLAYGFLWGSSESALNTDFKCTEIKDNAISADLTNLSNGTQYWYKAYVRLDSQTFYSVVKTFTTDVVPVESVSLDKSEYTFNTIGNTLTLNATVLPSDATDKSVEWSSDKEDVAAVDANGKVTAKANGKAIITVTTKDQGKTAFCEVTVAQLVTGIMLDKSSVTLNEGETYNLIPTVNPDNAAEKKLAWTSSDESIATVDQTGKVTAVSKGAATIKATATDGSGKYASCSVTVKRLVSSIQLNKTSLTLYRSSSNVTETITATVTPSDANNTSIDWTSSNPTAATVSNGVITAKAPGTTIITASAKDGSGVQATCEVEVKQYVTSITLSKTSLILLVGAEEALSVTGVLPDNANDKSVSWTSSDDAIAFVDQNGKITAKAKGNMVIKATANDGSGVCASCAVRVKEPYTAVAGEAVDLGLSVKWSSMNLGATSPTGYGDYFAWGETAPKDNYSWATYELCNGSSSTLTKYNNSSSYGTVDNKTEFKDYDYEDDAARRALGGKWRIPTDAEWTELRNNCTWTWVTNYNGSGIKGRLVKSKTNSNSIFLPAAGYRNDTNLTNAGSGGYYWSSSLYTDYPSRAWDVNFDSGGVGKNYYYRFYGQSFRPVSE